MARHNRDGQGVDQGGHQYAVIYQPDWLKHVKVTRDLDTGRQSTKTLFRNPSEQKEAEPGERVRTRITCSEQDLDFEVAISDPLGAVRRIKVVYEIVGENGEKNEPLEFTLERLPNED